MLWVHVHRYYTTLCVTAMKSKFISRCMRTAGNLWANGHTGQARETENVSLFAVLPYSQLVSSATGFVRLFEQLKIIRLKIIVFGIVDVECLLVLPLLAFAGSYSRI